MKYLLYLLILSIAFQLQAQSNCPAAGINMLKQAKAERKAKNYEKAINKCTSARNCDPNLVNEADKLILQIFQDIENEKKVARRNELRAIAAEDSAKIEKNRAERERDTANQRKIEVERKNKAILSSSMLGKIEEDKTNPTTLYHLAKIALELDSTNELAMQYLFHSLYTDTIPWNRSLVGHQKQVNDVAFAEKYRHLASASFDGTIMIWNIDTGQLLKIISIDTFTQFSHVAYSPDGNSLMGTTTGGRIYRWRTKDYQLIQQYIPTKEWAPIKGVIFSLNSEKIYYAKGENIWVWEFLTSKQPYLLSEYGHNDNIWDIELSPDGTKLVSVSKDFTLKIWDLTASELLKSIKHIISIKSVAFSPNGKMIAFGDLSGNIQLIDENYEIMNYCGDIVTAHKGLVSSLFFLNDTLLFSASQDKTIKQWNVITGDLISSLEGNIDKVNAITLSPNKQFVFASFGDDEAMENDNVVKIWDLSSKDKSNYTHQDVGNVYCDAQSQTIALLRDTILFIQDTKGNFIDSFVVNYSFGEVQLFSNAIFFVQDNNVAFLRDIFQHKTLFSIKMPSMFWGKATIDSDKKWIALTDSLNNVHIWDIRAKHEINSLQMDKEITCMTFYPNKAKIILGLIEGGVRIWDFEKGRIDSFYTDIKNAMDSPFFCSSTGDTLIFGLNEKIYTWNISTHQAIFPPIIVAKTRRQVNYIVSFGAKQIASLSFDPAKQKNSLKIWDLNTGERLYTIFVGQEVMPVSFTKHILTLRDADTHKIMSMNLIPNNRNDSILSHIGWFTPAEIEYYDLAEAFKNIYGENIAMGSIKEKNEEMMLIIAEYYVNQSKVNRSKKEKYLKDAILLFNTLSEIAYLRPAYFYTQRKQMCEELYKQK